MSEAMGLTGMTVAELGGRIRAKEISPVEATEAYLARIEERNPEINAYITVTADRARADAWRAQEEIARGEYRGPLHGVPIALKDLYQTAGVRTTAGSRILWDWVPTEDSAAAQKLWEAGSVLLGKLNTHEFAWGVTTNNPHHGPTRNPWDTSRIPGGSSGGSGAAIAAGMVAATLGSDTGGSIRIPAALCGCVGLKPTYGRVSKRGVVPMSFLYDHAGPIVQSVEDAAILLEAIAGYDPGDPDSARVEVGDYTSGLGKGIRGMRVGIPRQYFFENLDAEVAQAVEGAADTLRRLGAEVRDVPMPLTRDLTSAAFAIVPSESAAYHAAWFADRREEYGADLQQILSGGAMPQLPGGASIKAAEELRSMVQSALAEVDVLLTPTCPMAATPIGVETLPIGGSEAPIGSVMAGLTMPYNIARVPVISVPCGFTSGGLPIGMSLAGRPFEEETVLRAAHAYEQATYWHRRRP